MVVGCSAPPTSPRRLPLNEERSRAHRQKEFQPLDVKPVWQSESQAAPIVSLAYDELGRYFASGAGTAASANITIWDSANRKVLASHETSEQISALAFLKQGEQAVAASFDNTVFVWERPTPGRIEKVQVGGPPGLIGLSTAPNERLAALIFRGGDTVVSIVELPTWKTVNNFERRHRAGRLVTFISDNVLCMGGFDDGSIRLVHAMSGRILKRWSRAGASYSRLAVSLSSQAIAAFDNRRQVIDLFDVAEDPKQTASIKVNDDIRCLTFSPNGKYLLAAFGEAYKEPGIVTIWEATEYKQIARFTAHERAVLSIAVSPDGQTIITGGGDAILKMWNIPEIVAMSSN
jgi:WD40 repeat protein